MPWSSSIALLRSASSTPRPNRSGGWTARRCLVVTSAFWGSTNCGERKATEDPRTISPRSRSSGGWQPYPCRAVGLARRNRRSKPQHRIRPRHHQRGRAARADGRAQSGGRQDQPRGCRHRPRSGNRLHQRRVYRDVRLFGRGSTGPAGHRTAGGPRNRPQDAGKVAALGGGGNRRRGRSPRLRQERRRDLVVGQRQGVPR